MDTKDKELLQEFLHFFGTSSLGEGDPIAGANTLACMVCTLANIARPGSGISTSDGRHVQVGTSLLVSGSLSCSLTNDLVANGLRTTQNNLVLHLRRILAEKLKTENEPGPTTSVFPDGPASNGSEAALLNLQRPDIFAIKSVAQEWSEILKVTPNARIQDLASHPKIVVTAAHPSELKKQLIGLHLGHPLVLLGLSRSCRSQSFGDLLTAIIEGRLSDGGSGESIKGNLLITDPDNVLPEITKTADGSDTWLGHTLWLLDGGAGPEAPSPPTKATGAPLPDINGRFDAALGLAFGQRLDQCDPSPMTHPFSDFADAQIRWVKFLRGMESRLPGITGTARKLLATLTFGILELCNIPGYVKGGVQVPYIEAFARFLVHRMSNAHATMKFSAKESRRLKLQQDILQRLSEGCHTPRELVRRFSRLPVAECREALQALEASGTIIRKGDTFGLSDSFITTATPLTITT